MYCLYRDWLWNSRGLSWLGGNLSSVNSDKPSTHVTSLDSLSFVDLLWCLKTLSLIWLSKVGKHGIIIEFSDLVRRRVTYLPEVPVNEGTMLMNDEWWYMFWVRPENSRPLFVSNVEKLQHWLISRYANIYIISFCRLDKARGNRLTGAYSRVRGWNNWISA